MLIIVNPNLVQKIKIYVYFIVFWIIQQKMKMLILKEFYT